MSSINPGDIVRVYTDPPFTNASGTATDPTTVTLRWRLGQTGDETVLVYGVDSEVVKDGSGAFHVDIEVTDHGVYYYRWEGTGTVEAAEAGQFYSRDAYPFVVEDS